MSVVYNFTFNGISYAGTTQGPYSSSSNTLGIATSGTVTSGGANTGGGGGGGPNGGAGVGGSGGSGIVVIAFS